MVAVVKLHLRGGAGPLGLGPLVRREQRMKVGAVRSRCCIAALVGSMACSLRIRYSLLSLCQPHMYVS